MISWNVVICSSLLVAAAPRGPGGAETKASATPEDGLPWKLDTDHRFVWIKDRRKVGETLFRVGRTREGGKLAYKLSARREYTDERTALRATETTVFGPTGEPLTYEESLHVSTIMNRQAYQQTTIRFSEGKAHLKYVPNKKEEAAIVHEVDIPADTFLFASNAVEHWALFAPHLIRGGKEQQFNLFYPDHKKVLEVKFERAAPEKLEIRGKKIETVRYAFRSSQNEMRGEVWLDDEGRLIQVSFPNRSESGPDLRVVLASE